MHISHSLSDKAVDAVIVVGTQNIILTLGNGQWKTSCGAAMEVTAIWPGG